MVDPRPTNRLKDHLKRARHTLENWRVNTVRTRYPKAFTASDLLPDNILKTLASHRHIQTVAEMKDEVRWLFTARHGDEVLEELRKVDKRVHDEMVARREEKKAATAAKNEEKRQRAVMERQAKRDQQNKERLEATEQARLQKELKKQMKEHRKPPPKRPRRPVLRGCSTINFGQQALLPAPPDALPLYDVAQYPVSVLCHALNIMLRYLY